MSTQLGVGFGKTSEKTGKYFVNIVINEEIRKIYPVLNDLNIMLWQVENMKENDKAPDFNLFVSVRKKEEEK